MADMRCPDCLAVYEAYPDRVRVETDKATGWLVAYIDRELALCTDATGHGLWARTRDGIGQPDWSQQLGASQFDGRHGGLAREANRRLHRHTWETGQLTAAEAAERSGVTPDSWREMVRLGRAPKPDGYLGRTPWWHPATIEAWLPTRRRRGRPRQQEASA